MPIHSWGRRIGTLQLFKTLWPSASFAQIFVATIQVSGTFKSLKCRVMRSLWMFWGLCPAAPSIANLCTSSPWQPLSAAALAISWRAGAESSPMLHFLKSKSASGLSTWFLGSFTSGFCPKRLCLWPPCLAILPCSLSSKGCTWLAIYVYCAILMAIQPSSTMGLSSHHLKLLAIQPSFENWVP